MTIETDLQKLRDLKEDLDFIAHNAAIDKLTTSIKAEVIATGITVKTDIGEAAFKAKYIRDKWDGKKLHGLAIACPEILKCLSETTVKETVAIKFNKHVRNQEQM